MMRNFIHIVENAQTTVSGKELFGGDFLAWVSPDGVIHSDGGTHEAIAANILGIDVDQDRESYEFGGRLYNKGYARLTASNAEFGLDWTVAPTAALLRAVAKFIRDNPDFPTYYIGVDTFPDKKLAMSALNRAATAA